MKTIDFKEVGVRELEKSIAIYTEGGLTVPVTSAWWNALVTYVTYSMETGGQYVTYHGR
jgi:hypothetical protein